MPILFATSYLPPICYMAQVIRTDEIIIEAWETYTKQTCRNHCNIYGPNGRQTLSIPVKKVNGNHTLTRDIRISYDQAWHVNHWRSITAAYNNSPFFLYYEDLFAPLFKKQFDFLIDYNQRLLESVLKSLKINIPVQFSTEFSQEGNGSKKEWLVSKKCNFINQVYHQVFSDKAGFIPNLSIIDLLFNLGPESYGYLHSSPSG